MRDKEEHKEGKAKFEVSAHRANHETLRSSETPIGFSRHRQAHNKGVHTHLVCGVPFLFGLPEQVLTGHHIIPLGSGKEISLYKHRAGATDGEGCPRIWTFCERNKLEKIKSEWIESEELALTRLIVPPTALQMAKGGSHPLSPL